MPPPPAPTPPSQEQQRQRPVPRRSGRSPCFPRKVVAWHGALVFTPPPFPNFHSGPQASLAFGPHLSGVSLFPVKFLKFIQETRHAAVIPAHHAHSPHLVSSFKLPKPHRRAWRTGPDTVVAHESVKHRSRRGRGGPHLRENAPSCTVSPPTSCPLRCGRFKIPRRRGRSTLLEQAM